MIKISNTKITGIAEQSPRLEEREGEETEKGERHFKPTGEVEEDVKTEKGAEETEKEVEETEKEEGVTLQSMFCRKGRRRQGRRKWLGEGEDGETEIGKEETEKEVEETEKEVKETEVGETEKGVAIKS